jgi:predicted XRE-type DNA-binding protein
MRLDQQLRQQLAREFCAIVEGWTVTQVATHAGIYPSRVSELRNGKVAGYSISRLITLIAKFGYDIEIAIRPTKRPIIVRQGPTTVVQRYDQLDQPIPPTSDPGSETLDWRPVPDRPRS